MAGPWEAYQTDKKPSPKEREAAAGASKAEAAATIAPELTQAQLRETQLRADRLEADLAAKEAKDAVAAEAAAGKQSAAQDKARSDKELLLSVLKNIQLAKDKVNALGATGLAAQVTGGLYGSPAKQLEAALRPIKSQVVLEALQRARTGSAVGATGFGALQIRELKLLEDMWGSLQGDLPPEDILRTLNEFDTRTRRFLAYDAGYDPDTAEGAALFQLPMPEGAEEEFAPPEGGEVSSGDWKKNPELAGIDASIKSMIKGGRSAEQIRQFLNEYQPGLGDKLRGIEAQVDYYKATGEEPQGSVERYFEPSQPGLISQFTDTPVGAGVQAAANQMAMGLTGFIPGEEGQRIRAVQRGLAEKYPTATTIGDVAGGVGSAITGGMLGRSLGLKGPQLLEGVAQEGVRGAAMAEPGDRTYGAVEGGLGALGGNVLFKPISSVAGSVLRGMGDDAATLSQKYDIDLTPGQIAGVDEKTLAGAPLVGSQVQARRNESLEQFNRAAFDDALAPIGARAGAVGQEGVATAQQAVSDAYDAALGGLVLNIDQPMLASLRGAPYANLGKLKDVGPELQRSVDDIFAKYADPQNGVISGENLQNALQEMQQLKNAYKQDPRWANRIAPALDDISDGYSGVLERQAPENFKLFRDANTAYRNVSVLGEAVLKASDGELFGPQNLRAATNQGTFRFGGRRAAARGDKPFNELIQAGTGVIPKQVDEVSLAGRLMPVGAGAGAAGGISLMAAPSGDDQTQDTGTSYVPPSLLAAGAGAALASLPYSRGGTRLTNMLMGGPRSTMQKNLGDLIGTYLTPAARGALLASVREPGVPMPQEPVSPDAAVSDEMRNIIRGSVSNTRPDYGDLPDMRSPEDAYVEVDELGRVIDPITGLPIEEDVVGYKRGGAVKGYKEGGPTARDRARAVGQGVTFGFGDEIEGGIRALGGVIGEGDLMALRQKYLQERDMIRAQQRAYEDEYPIESLLYEGGGAMLTGLIPGAQGATAARMAQLAARSPRAARAAAVAADTALYGAGSAESIRDIPRSIRDEALFAVPMYGGAEGIRMGVKRYKGRKKK